MAPHSPEGPLNTGTDSDIIRRGLHGEPVDPPEEHRDTHATKDEIQRLTNELKEKEAAEVQRKKRNRVGAGVLASVVGLGAAFGIGKAVSGGEDEPRTDAQPTSVSGEQTPGSENPSEAPVANPEPGTSPTDIPTFESDNPTSSDEVPATNEIAIPPRSIDLYPLKDVQEYYSGMNLTEMFDLADRERWAYAATFAADKGVTETAVPSMQEYGPVTIGGVDYLNNNVQGFDNEISEQFDLDNYHQRLTNDMAVFGNIYLAHKDDIPFGDLAMRRDMINGLSSQFVEGGQQYVDGTLECDDTNTCYDAEKASPLLERYIETLDSLPEGTMIGKVRMHYIDQLANGTGTATLTVDISTKTGDDMGSGEVISLETNNSEVLFFEYSDTSAVPTPFNKEIDGDWAQPLLVNHDLHQ